MNVPTQSLLNLMPEVIATLRAEGMSVNLVNKLEQAMAEPATDGCPDGWKLVPDYSVGMLVKFDGEEYKIFARGDKPGTFDICHPTDGHRDRWLNVPPDKLQPLHSPTPPAGEGQEPVAVPPPIFGDEEHVFVPRGLLASACSAIDKKRDAIKTLAELRRYTTGDLSEPAHQAAQGDISKKKVFTIGVLGHPMREYAPGKWESAVWPSDAPKPAQDEREAFETKFPLPAHCVRCGDGYAATEYGAWDAHQHVQRWKGWQARAALSTPPMEGALLKAVADVCEGWTLPDGARKHLETALWSERAAIAAMGGNQS